MNLGFPNDTSRSKQVQRPAGVDVTVWLTPSECRWDYIPEGPYRIVRASLGYDEGRHYFAWEDDLTEGEMFGSLVARHLPRPMQLCVVSDAHLQVVLGWVFSRGGLEWAGCARMFGFLAEYHNPIDAGVWERSAMRHIERNTTLEAMSWDT